MMSPEEITALLQQGGSGISPDDYDEAAQPIGARQQRAESLRPVLETCQQVWFSPNGEIDLIAEKLGDASRDPGWRLPLGDAGILNFFLQGLAVGGLRHGLQIHTLRIIGNSCADTDENRARVVESNLLAPIIRDLDIESLIPFTIPVLFNILVDYEPAQLAASQAQLNHRLILLLSSPNISEHAPFITYFCKILAMLVTQEGEIAQAHPLTVPVLLNLATSPLSSNDLEDFLALTSAAISYLASETFQMSLIMEDQMPIFMSVLYHVHTNISVDQIDDPDLVDQLRKLKIALLNSLADLTGNDAFFNVYPLQSPVSQTFWTWLHAPNPGLQAAACLALGNYTRSDELSYALVQTHSAHVPVITLISNPDIDDSQLLHAALSFLKNLAIPAANKPLLGDLFNASCIPRIYALDAMPHVQFAAVSLTRILLVNCPLNVTRFCAPLSPDPSSPAHERTNVHALTSLFERSDADPTRLEAARSVASICRVLHMNPVAPILPDWDPSLARRAAPTDGLSSSQTPFDDNDDGKRRYSFYQMHNLATILSFLVTQTKWPALRSEAWFVFALMCRSREGAGLIIMVLAIDAFSLIDAITGRKTIKPAEEQSGSIDNTGILSGTDDLGLEPQQIDPSQKANMVKVDRENGIVLCTELVRKWGDDLPPLRLSLLRDLIKEGTEAIAAEKAQSQ